MTSSDAWARQQKAGAAGRRAARSLMGLLRPPLERGAKQPFSDLEQILGRVISALAWLLHART